MPSQNLQIPSTQRVIHPISVEGKQIVPLVNHRPKGQLMPKGSSRELNKQSKYYLPQQTFPNFLSTKPQNFPERQMFDPSQTVSQQPEINHPENRDLEFPECQDIETNSPYQEEIIEQEYNRPTKNSIRIAQNWRDKLTEVK